MITVRGGARAALALALAASLAANVLAAEPTVVGRAIASWPPVALFIAIALLERVPLVPGHPARAAARTGGAVAVAGVAAFVSYRHMNHLATGHGESRVAAALLPLSVDGLIIVASMVLLDLRALAGRPAVSTVPIGWETEREGTGVSADPPVTPPPVIAAPTLAIEAAHPERVAEVVGSGGCPVAEAGDREQPTREAPGVRRPPGPARPLAADTVARIEQAIADGHTTIPAIATAANVSERSVSRYRAQSSTVDTSTARGGGA